MLTREQVLLAVKGGRESECVDGRDYSRLCEFFPSEDYKALGFGLKEGADPQPVREWTEDEVKSQLKVDVKFGFEKALNQRGLSAGAMYEVVKMWMWVLQDDLQWFNEYAQYGLPLFKAVAVKYGFDNPIGDDEGNESEYEG